MSETRRFDSRPADHRGAQRGAIHPNRRTDDELFAHAALVLVVRPQWATVEEAVGYLHSVAADIGVDAGELARIIVDASERRGRGAAQTQPPRPVTAIATYQRDDMGDTA